MNLPRSLTSSLTGRWVVLLLGAALLLSVTFTWLRGEERDRLEASARIARNYGRATDDLNTGFLHVTLGTRQDGPWERTRGIVLLRQALRELEAATLGLPRGDALNQRFRQDLATFEGVLRAEEARPGTLASEVALHLALAKLKSTADEVDARLRSDQQQANERFDRNFFVGLVAGLLALAVLAVLTLRTLSAQQRVTRQLQDSESKFRGLVEQSIAGVIIVRDGIVLYANPRAAEVFGRALDALVGLSIVELVPARYRAECASIATRLMGDPSDSFSGALTGLLPDGREIRLEVQANPMRMNDAPAVLGIVQDVTERHRIDAERIEALQLLESISRSSGDAVFAKDLNGRFKLFNAQAERISGFSARDVLGYDDFKTLPPEEAKRTMADDQLVIREKRVQRAEWTLPSPNGLRTLDVVKGPLFDKRGRVTGLFGVARDITERKLEEQALQESRAELEAIIDALDEGLIIYSADGQILRSNPAARRIAGLDVDPPQGISVAERKASVSFETLDGQPIPFEEWPAQRTLRGEEIRNFECVLVNAAGIRRIVSCGSGLVRGPDGQIRLGFITSTDITERKKAVAAMMQSQRLESLGTLAAGIAHDFNNILLAITGNASLADQELQPNHPAHASLAEVQRAGQRAKDLVRRILLFARAEDPQRRTSDLGEVVSEAVELMRTTLPARIQLLKDLPTAALAVDMDTSQIHQVLVNLITNAGHAIDDAGVDRRGRVRVTLSEAEFSEPLQFGLRTLPAGLYARLVVEDDGCGMDEAVLARVFDPFFTTKIVGRGTGLGLSIVQGIVTDHGGAIALTSTVGKGTRVEILLPRSGTEARASVLARAAVAAGAGRHVLYIDDEAALVSLITRFLQRQGYQVTGSTDPQEALRVFDLHPERYDLVVTDLSMPQMSGFDVARAVRERSSTVPVILMSGYVRPEDRDRALALGVREVLLKPATVEELCQSIDRQLH